MDFVAIIIKNGVVGISLTIDILFMFKPSLFVFLFIFIFLVATMDTPFIFYIGISDQLFFIGSKTNLHLFFLQKRFTFILLRKFFNILAITTLVIHIYFDL